MDSAPSLARIGAPIWGGWVLGQLGAHAPSLSAAAILFGVLIYAVALFWTAINLPRPQFTGGLNDDAEA